MTAMHEKMLTGDWVIEKPGHSKATRRTCAPILGRASNNNMTYATKTWRLSGTRFFAFLTAGNYWCVWVMAACGKTAAEGFRAEIRLASDAMPDCSNVFLVPVLHFDNEVLVSKWNAFFTNRACVKVCYKVVGHYCANGNDTRIWQDTNIPFNCLVRKKVFVIPNKTDIEEKEEDMEEAMKEEDMEEAT